MKQKVVLCTIAKDEGAYLAHWIAYHLSIGIEHIIVMVNKTNDSTRQQLEKIAAYYPVSLFEADQFWADNKRPIDDQINPTFLEKNPFQSRALQKSYNLATNRKFDYLLAIDVDEFLYLEAHENISDFILQNPADIYEFNWFNICGEDKPFEPALKSTIAGDRVHLSKLMIRTGIDKINIVNPHKAKSTSELTIYNSLESNDGNLILHRYHRSEMEYLATLGKGDVLHMKHGFKGNRMGFDTTPKESLTIQHAKIQTSNEASEQLINKCNLAQEIAHEQSNVMNLADKVIKAALEIDSKERLNLNIFKGTRLNPEAPVKKFW